MEVNYFSPVDVGRFLAERGIRLTKRFGQNFLIDRNKALQLVSLMGLEPGDTVLEIGPGLGTMTHLFLSRVKKTAAVEIDRGLCAILRETMGADPGFELHEADFLKLDPVLLPAVPMKVYSSLPYATASQILIRLAGISERVTNLAVLLPDEIVARMTATPSNSQYGVFAVFMDAFFRIEDASVRVDRGCFFPRPKVDSRYVRLAPVRGGGVDPAESREFIAFVSSFFQRRRKLFSGTLRLLAERAGTFDGPFKKEKFAFLVGRYNLSPDARPEDVPPAAYRELFRVFRHSRISGG